jgi:hypothetical protein
MFDEMPHWISLPPLMFFFTRLSFFWNYWFDNYELFIFVVFYSCFYGLFDRLELWMVELGVQSFTMMEVVQTR